MRVGARALISKRREEGVQLDTFPFHARRIEFVPKVVISNDHCDEVPRNPYPEYCVLVSEAAPYSAVRSFA